MTCQSHREGGKGTLHRCAVAHADPCTPAYAILEMTLSVTRNPDYAAPKRIHISCSHCLRQCECRLAG
jgi:hypothetical protein